ncbi:MAG: DNA repair protein RecN [Sodalinema sp.]|uniref:DNA repair protein RecN n=1 Tax=Sodalinema sp. TaxID=3080550 RepID=UPI0012221D7E|nr:MAG: DNA repair protein RecN [Phormidium sp. SL48-SHIP]
MLVRLQIENFALIDDLDLSFGSGLNVLTGETGAGKSIVLDAVDLVLGGKASRRAIRTGADRAQVQAWFNVAPPGEAESAIACSRQLLLGKRGCRSKYRLNGKSASQREIQQLRQRLVEIAAQGQAIQLAQTPHQRRLLDLYGGEKLLKDRDHVGQEYDALQRLRARLQDLQKLEEQRSQQEQLWRYQWEELSRAQLTHPQELQDLEAEAQRLNHVVELQQQSYRLYQTLYDHDGETAAADLLGHAETLLQDMVSYDKELTPLLNLVGEALVRVQEAGEQINRYGDELEADPGRLQEVETRLGQLKQICRKYGPSLAEAIERRESLQQQLNDLENGEKSRDEVEQRCQEQQQRLHQSCQRLRQRRQQAAHQLEARLIAALQPLAMENLKFQVELSPTQANRWGSDRVRFLFSANPGEPLEPLGDIASGGEMSRFLLALKACFSEVDPVGTLIFDEIDVGVSGRVANTIAETLYRLSRHHQVLCVTHQPLVAAMADHHFQVVKQAVSGGETARTRIEVRSLNSDQRRQELAQLVSGQRQGDIDSAATQDAANAFADSLLSRAERLRQELSTVRR